MDWGSPGKNTGVGSIPFSRGSSRSKDQTQVFCIAGRFFTVWAIREAQIAHTNNMLTVVLKYLKVNDHTYSIRVNDFSSLPLFPHSGKWQKWYLFWVLVLEDLVGLHRIIQLQHYWLGHKLGLLWYWMVYLGNEPKSFCHFWDCTQVLNFRLFCWLWGLFHFS